MRVIECGGFAAAYAGRLFADRKADVIKVEPPGGDPMRWAPPRAISVEGEQINAGFVYFNINKRFVTLDLAGSQGLETLGQLVCTADVVLLEEPWSFQLTQGGLADRWRGRNPGLAIVAATPFGLNGPYSAFVADDLVTLAMAGLLGPSGSVLGDPVRFPGHFVDYILGAAMAAAASMALYGQDEVGGGALVDFSKQAAMAALTTVAPSVPKYLQEGFRPKRSRSTPGFSPSTYPTKDGMVRLTAYVDWMWPVLARWINESTGETEVLSPRFDAVGRLQYAELIDHWISELTQRYTTEELLFEAQQRKLTAASVNTVGDVLRSPQLQARGYFHPAQWSPSDVACPGPAYRVSSDPWSLRTAPGKPGRDNEAVFRELVNLELR